MMSNMKRIIGFLAIAALAACTCLSQIPDQPVYVDQNCEAVMPNFIPDIIAADNCDPSTVLVQSPAAGSIVSQSVTPVTVTATDNSGNSASISFNVIQVDTIPPSIEAGPGLLSLTWEERGAMLTTYQKQIHKDVIEGYAAAPDSMKHLLDSLLVMENNMITVSEAGITGKHMGTFVDPSLYAVAMDSTYLVDSLEMNILQLQFSQP